MRRIERRLLRLNDELQRLRREEELVEGELNMHRHLADDAVRDAAVHGGIDRAEARDAVKDVHRQEEALRSTKAEIARVEEKRRRLLDRLEE